MTPKVKTTLKMKPMTLKMKPMTLKMRTMTMVSKMKKKLKTVQKMRSSRWISSRMSKYLLQQGKIQIKEG